MKTKIKLNISKKIWLGFGILIICFTINSFFILLTLSNNSKLVKENTDINMPSVTGLQEMRFLINESKMLIKNWAFIEKQEDTPGKLELKKLHATDFLKVKEKISAISVFWGKDEQDKLNNLFLSIQDSLFKKHKFIMERLSSFNSYDELINAFEVYPLVEDEGEIINLSNSIINRIEFLEHTYEKKLELANQDIEKSSNSFKIFVILMGLFSILTAVIAAFSITSLIVKPINDVKEIVLSMGRGVLPKERIIIRSEDEIGKMLGALNLLIDSLKSTSEFSLEIGKGNFTHEFKPLCDEDNLGNSLISMRDSIKRTSEENERRAWANQGHAKFADILRRNNNDIVKLADELISNLVHYINANQGGFFVYHNEDSKNIHLELVACYAFNRKKFAEQIIPIKEGLVGTCAIEKQTIYLTEIPEDYIKITSGLGDGNPRSIILVPLKIEEMLYGVIELASFNKLEQHEIQFLEKVGESIASTFASVKNNIKTKELLFHTQQQTEELQAQEEEMRQNIEEMHATQDEMVRKEASLNNMLTAIDNSSGTIEFDLNGVILTANAKYLEITNTQIASLKGYKISKFMSKDKVNSDEYKTLWENLNDGMIHCGRHQYFFNKEEKWFLETFTPVRDTHDIITKILCLSSDVTQSVFQYNKSKEQAEILEAQEEKMRQNLEEMSVIKEELEKKDIIQKQENDALVAANNSKIEEMLASQEELKRKERDMASQLEAIDKTLAVLEYDTKGIILKANEIFCNILNYSENELIGKHHSIVIEDKNLDNPMYLHFWETLRAGQHVQGEKKRISKNGSLKTVVRSSFPFFDTHGKIYKILEVFIDITHQKN